MKHAIYLKKKTSARNYKKFPKKLAKLRDWIIRFKKDQANDTEYVKLLYVLHSGSVPKPLTTFYEPISDLFSVIIIKQEIISGSDVVSTYKVLGPKRSCEEASRLLFYICELYRRSVAKRSQAVKRKRKQLRRLRRRWHIIGALADARFNTSRFKAKVIKELRKPIDDLLEHIQSDHSKLFKNGLLKTKDIKHYFYLKYGRKWKSKV